MLNGKPVIDSGGDSLLQTTAELPFLTDATIYMVGLQKAADATGGRFLNCNTNLRLSRNGSNDGVIAEAGSGFSFASTTITDDTFYSIRVRLTATNIYLSINNATEIAEARTPSGVAQELQLFTNAGAFGNKQMAELLIYTASHDSTQRGLVEAYLRTAYAHY